MDTNEVIINKIKHSHIHTWLSENVANYRNDDNYQNKFTLTIDGKININGPLIVKEHVREFKYPFKDVRGEFNCSFCKNLISLIGSPEKVGDFFDCRHCHFLISLIGAPKEVGGDFNCSSCSSLMSFVGFPKNVNGNMNLNINKYFFNHPYNKSDYKCYLAMWLELLESVNNEERIEYINNYKDKKAHGAVILPIEILKEYGF